MNIVVLDHGTLTTGDITPLNDIATKLVCYKNTSPEQVVERCLDMDIVITNKVIINKLTLQKLKIKLICIAATGTNNVDLVAANLRGIAVTHVADYSTPSVVQHTFSLLFNLLGNTHKYIQDCQQGKWQASKHFCLISHPMQEVQNKTLSIIGYGVLGKAIAKVAIAFGMRVLIAERAEQIPREGRVSFETAIKNADVISVHCPLTEETKNLITAKEFSYMKKKAVLINTARGGIINEQDLVNALNTQQIAGAAFDVLSKEPATDNNPLIHYRGDNLLLTPHIAWASQESVSRLIIEMTDNIQAFMQGERRNRV